MTHKFAKYLILATSALGLSALPALATTCGDGGGTIVVTGTVCSLGGLTFDFEGVTFVPGTPVPTLEIVTPFSGIYGSDYVLDFQYLAGTVPSDIHLTYSVTSTSANIVQVDNSYSFVEPNTPPSSIHESVCGSDPALHAGACTPLLASYINTTGDLMFSNTFGPLSQIWIKKDITNNGFSEFTDSVVATPEPSSIGFLLFGAFGLVAASRKFRRA